MTIESTVDLLHQDELTGLFNRRYFNQRLAQWESQAQEGTAGSFAIAVIDVDHFKAINDHYGHLDGDELLRQVAEVYQRQAAAGVIPIRYAGDEFVLLMEGIARDRAVQMAEEIRAAVAATEFGLGGDGGLKITNSIGVAHFPSDTERVRELFELADQAALLAKRQGRNRVAACNASFEAVDKQSLYRRFPCPRLVGRAEIVGALEALVPPRIQEGTPIAVLEGEGGHGKSRLIAHLLERAHPERTLMLTARGIPSVTRQPFGMLCAALSRYAREDPMGTPFMAEVMTDLQRAEVARFIPALLMYSGGVAAGLSGAERREALLSGFVAILREMTARKGLALLFDDAQHLDWGTLQVLQAFADTAEAKSTLILLGFRGGPEGADTNPHLGGFLTWARDRQKLSHFLVEPLSLDEVVEMVEAILPRLDRPLDLATTLFHRSDGVPLFIEELIKFLIHRDLVRAEGGALVLGEVAPEDLPENVGEAFAKRTEDLDEEIRSVLSAAAVLGPEFNLQLLSRLEGKDEGYVADVLEKARRAQVIRSGAQAEDTYDFLFAEGQAAFYGTLDSLQRKHLHGRAGDAVEEMRGEDAAAELAYHFEQAGESDRATRYATVLARTYADLSAPDEVTAWTKLLPGGKEWGHEAELTDDEMKRAQRLARVLKTSIQNFRIFPAHSEILLDTRDAAHEELTRLLEITESLTFSEAGETGFINAREPVLGPFDRNPVVELMAVLGRSGLKGISFRRGVTEAETFKFLELLALRPYEIKEKGGWTELLAAENVAHVVVNERVYVAMSERDLLEGKAVVAGPAAQDQDLLQELADLIRTEGDALRDQLMASDSFKSRLDALIRAMKGGGDAAEAAEEPKGLAALPPWMRVKGAPFAAQVAAVKDQADMDYLAEIWDDLVVLFKELESGNRARANSATRSLLSRGKEVVAPLFQFIKSSDDLRARKIAMKIIERFEPEFKARLLREIRTTQQSDERIRMISLLDSFATPDVLSSLVGSVHAHHRELRREAIRVVEGHGSTQAEALLIKALESEHEPVKVDAINALARLGRDTAVPDLIKLIRPVSVFFDEEYVEAQCEACAALGRLRDKSAIAPLARALRRRWPFPFGFVRTKPPPVRAAAAAALGQFQDPRARAILKQHFRDRDVAVRSVCKLAMGGSLG